MEDPKNSTPETDPAPQDQPQDETPGAAPEASTAESLEEALGSQWSEGADAARLAELEAENADVKDRLLRLAAEMENLRRRTAKEVSDAKLYAIASFARDVLTVGDNLQRTMSAVVFEEGEEPDARLKGFLEGIEMTDRDLVNILARHGITRIDPKGEKFDPNLHEAVVQMPDPTVPAGMVAEVMQQGYKIGERVLRPAMVGVTAGGPKLSADPDAGPSEPGSNVDTTA